MKNCSNDDCKKLRELVKRLALGLIDANRLNYPWKCGSRASNALDEAEKVIEEGYLG